MESAHEREVCCSLQSQKGEALLALWSDVELQDLESALLGFDLAFVLYFPQCPFLSFGMIVYILWHCILEVYKSQFAFITSYIWDIALSLRRDFDTLLRL